MNAEQEFDHNALFLARLRYDYVEEVNPEEKSIFCNKCDRVRAAPIVKYPAWLHGCSMSTCPTLRTLKNAPRGRAEKLLLLYRRGQGSEDAEDLLETTSFFKAVRKLPNGAFVAVGSSGAGEEYCHYHIGSWIEASSYLHGLLVFATPEGARGGWPTPQKSSFCPHRTTQQIGSVKDVLILECRGAGKAEVVDRTTGAIRFERLLPLRILKNVNVKSWQTTGRLSSRERKK